MSTERRRCAWIFGATGYIGSAVVARLVDDGWWVILSARTSEAIERLREVTDRGGERTCGLAGDLGSASWRTEAVATARRWATGADADLAGLVFAAAPSSTPAEPGEDPFISRYRAKCGDPVQLLELCTDWMESGGGGSVVLTGGADREVLPGHFAGSMANACVTFAAKALGIELAPRGIRVNAVSPGVIGNPDPAKLRPDLEERIPMGRSGEPMEIAEAISFLLSPKASYVTGSNLLVDGGFTRAV